MFITGWFCWFTRKRSKARKSSKTRKSSKATKSCKLSKSLIDSKSSKGSKNSKKRKTKSKKNKKNDYDSSDYGSNEENNYGRGLQSYDKSSSEGSIEENTYYFKLYCDDKRVKREHLKASNRGDAIICIYNKPDSNYIMDAIVEGFEHESFEGFVFQKFLKCVVSCDADEFVDAEDCNYNHILFKLVNGQNKIHPSQEYWNTKQFQKRLEQTKDVTQAITICCSLNLPQIQKCKQQNQECPWIVLLEPKCIPKTNDSVLSRCGIDNTNQDLIKTHLESLITVSTIFCVCS